MRELYDYIDSRDVRRYLKDIGFRFSQRDAAYLIWTCKRLSLEERHTAWRELMETCDDDELNDLLSKTIAEEDGQAQRLLAPGNARYTCISYCRNGKSKVKRGKCSSIEACLQLADKDSRSIEVKKRTPDGAVVYGLFSPDGILMDVDDDNRGERIRINDLKFEFPSPFKAGENLMEVNGEGVFYNAELTYLGIDSDDSMYAICEFINALGELDTIGTIMLHLERCEQD